jgi:hypothetical protein
MGNLFIRTQYWSLLKITNRKSISPLLAAAMTGKKAPILDMRALELDASAIMLEEINGF